MGAATTVGGFFVELGLVTDEKSFNAGQRKLSEFENSTKAIFGTVVKTSAALFGMAVASSAVSTAELKASKAIGVSVQGLEKWKAAAGIAGVSAGALTSQMGALETKMRRLKMGDVDMGLAKSLGMMGVGYTNFAKMDADQRMKTVFSKAGAMGDQELASQLVSDTLGQAAQEYYHYLQLSGKTLDQQLSQAKQLTFTTESGKKGAMAFQSEVKAIFGAAKSVGSLFGNELAKGLAPLVQKVKNYIIVNRELIQTKVADFAHGVADAFTRIFGVIEKVAPLVTRLVDGFGGFDKLIIKVGIGIAAMNIGKLVGGIAGVVKGIGLLKAAMSGLAMGAGFLILEDIFAYFTGGKSGIGFIIENFDNIKKKFANMIPAEAMEAIKKLISGISGAIETIKKSLPELKEIWGNVFGEAIRGMIENITVVVKDLVGIVSWAIELFNAFSKGGIEGGMRFIGKSMSDKGEQIGNAYSQAYNASKESGGSGFTNFEAGLDSGMRSIPIIGSIYTITDNAKNALINLLNGIGQTGAVLKKNSKVEDGIIRPDGRVTQVAADDWVFAAKDLGDMASAFIPSSIRNSSVNAPQTVSINQNFTFQTADRDISGIRQAVKQGTSDGIRQVMKRNTEILQLMPGAF